MELRLSENNSLCLHRPLILYSDIKIIQVCPVKLPCMGGCTHSLLKDLWGWSVPRSYKNNNSLFIQSTTNNKLAHICSMHMIYSGADCDGKLQFAWFYSMCTYSILICTSQFIDLPRLTGVVREYEWCQASNRTKITRFKLSVSTYTQTGIGGEKLGQLAEMKLLS